MKAPKTFWIGIICALGGCTQLLELDKDYQPGQTSSSSGEAGAGGTVGTGGTGGVGGGLECTVDGDCVASTNLCAAITCVANVCVTNNQPAGTICAADGTTACDGNGICGQCNQPTDCTMLPADDECQTRTCDNHVCGQMFAPTGTLLLTQKMGDCQEAFCDGAGVTMMQANDTDLPEDNNPCTKNVCTNGTPSHPPEASNTACGNGSICDGMGACVGCVDAADCSGMDDFCKKRTCTNGTCGHDFTASGTDLPTGQTTGDCKVVECDGQGNTVNSADNTDVPVDGNLCTKDLCTAGVPSNPFEPLNTPCGTGGICNGSGVCKKLNGQMCMLGSECSSANCIEGYCCDSTCTQTCKACNVAGSLGICTIVPAGYTDDTCASPKSCDGTQGGNSCRTKFPMGYPCTGGTQCGSGICVDGVCCNTSCSGTCKSCNVAGSVGTCANLPIGQDDGALCSGSNSCDGIGNCKKENGQGCSIGSDCLSGFCADGVCCNTGCLANCQACNLTGNIGTCLNVPAGADDSPNCTGTNSCDGNGSCKKDNSQTCATGSECLSTSCIDGVCCSTACLGTCQACNVAGSIGSCVNVHMGQEDPVATTACTGVYSCNGAGVCLLDPGQPCTNNAECASGVCNGATMTCQ